MAIYLVAPQKEKLDREYEWKKRRMLKNDLRMLKEYRV